MKNLLHLLLALPLFFPSCQNQLGCPDSQDNEILTKNPPASQAYQTELIRLIREDTRAVTYYFEKREKEYLVLNAYGWGYCGQLQVMLPEEDDFSQKLQNDEGWRGAKLEGLQLAETNGRMVYQGMEAIVD